MKTRRWNPNWDRAFNLTPARESPSTSRHNDSPRVFVTGILTWTFGPHPAISCACRSISGNSSPITSKEIGRSSNYPLATADLRAGSVLRGTSPVVFHLARQYLERTATF